MHNPHENAILNEGPYYFYLRKHAISVLEFILQYPLIFWHFKSIQKRSIDRAGA